MLSPHLHHLDRPRDLATLYTVACLEESGICKGEGVRLLNWIFCASPNCDAVISQSRKATTFDAALDHQKQADMYIHIYTNI